MGGQEEKDAYAEKHMNFKEQQYFTDRRTVYTRSRPDRKKNRKRNRIARKSRQLNRRK